ncbi:MAG: nuclear transport factor 2 family protein [Pseudomonadota bacterium]|nr:nuclear transport factor 2 family protein [Pseudomonadota bacterium]
MKIEELLVIEEIRALKAKYCYYIDLKDWDGYAGLFTRDASLVTDTAVSSRGEDPKSLPAVRGRDAIRQMISQLLVDAVTVHQCHTPIIELTSATTATGIWAMEDVVRMRGYHLHARGHYRERYVFEDGRWLIESLHLTRTMIDNLEGTFPPTMPVLKN